jgi:hypothetical protein
MRWRRVSGMVTAGEWHGDVSREQRREWRGARSSK